jgi:hypothetical protein
MGGSMLTAISSIGLVARANSTAANATILHCKGFQVDDRHPLTDQIIALDMKKNLVLGNGPKHVINAPIILRNEEIVWVYEAVRLSNQKCILQLLSDANNQLGVFDCETT